MDLIGLSPLERHGSAPPHSPIGQHPTDRSLDDLTWAMTLLDEERMVVSQMRWLGWMPGRPGRQKCIVRVCWEHLSEDRVPRGGTRGVAIWGGRPRGRPRTGWGDYISWMAWERLGDPPPPEELVEVGGEGSGLHLPSQTVAPRDLNPDKWKKTEQINTFIANVC